MKHLTVSIALLLAGATTSAQQLSEAEMLALLTGGKYRQWTQAGTTQVLGSSCQPGDRRYLFVSETREVQLEYCADGKLARGAKTPFTIVKKKGRATGVRFDNITYTVRKLPVEAPACEGHANCVELSFTDPGTKVTTLIFLYQ